MPGPVVVVPADDQAGRARAGAAHIGAWCSASRKTDHARPRESFRILRTFNASQGGEFLLGSWRAPHSAPAIFSSPIRTIRNGTRPAGAPTSRLGGISIASWRLPYAVRPLVGRPRLRSRRSGVAWQCEWQARPSRGEGFYLQGLAIGGFRETGRGKHCANYGFQKQKCPRFENSK